MDRLRFEIDRERFVLGRGLLRLLIAACLDTDPRAIEFGHSAAGKPRLARPSTAPIAFNLSHSGGRAVYVLTGGAECGIDIEQMRDGIDREGIARRFFAPGERERMARLPEPLRRRAFFETWARKEALLKATGEGIAGGLDHLEVRASRGRPPALVASPGSLLEPAGWFLADLPVARGFVAAMAVRAPAADIVRLTWRW